MPNEEHAHEAKEEMKKHGDPLEPPLEPSHPGATSGGEDAGNVLEPEIEIPKDVTPRDRKA